MPRRGKVHQFCGLLASLVAVLASMDAAAEGPLSLDRFQPAPAGDRMFGVPSPFVAGGLGPRAALVADYAHNPLVLRGGGGSDEPAAGVSSQLFLHLNGSVALWNRLSVSIDLPIALAQSGDDPSPELNQGLKASRGVQVGDLRLGARLRLFGGYYDALQLALGAYAWIPSGSDLDGSFVGDGGPRGQPQLIAGGLVDRVVWSAVIGPELRSTRKFDGVTIGSSLVIGGGVGYLVGAARRIQVGAEVVASTVCDEPEWRNTNAEVLASGRYRFQEAFEVGVAVGPGFSAGIGTPDLRAVAVLAFAPEPGWRASSRASSTRRQTKRAPVTAAGPRWDDASDVSHASDADKRGPPPSMDEQSEPMNDGIDARPQVDAAEREDATTSGSPARVRVAEGEIQILQQIEFENGESRILPSSGPLLGEIAGALKAHPEITKVEVQGHTDNRGDARFNESISQARAAAVVAALVRRGVDPSRLIAKGYGQKAPIADNKTAAGRKKNRRVQLAIIGQARPPR